MVDTELVGQMKHSPNTKGRRFSVDEYNVLCQIACGEKVEEEDLRRIRTGLLKEGLISSKGRGKGTAYSLVVETYETPEMFNGDQKLALSMLEKLNEAGTTGLAIASLRELFPHKSDWQIRDILTRLKNNKMVKLKGRTKSSRWSITKQGSVFLSNSLEGQII